MNRSVFEIGTVAFPATTGIAINMMPFVMGDRDSIPAQIRGYNPIIDACQLEPEQLGKIGYLSIQESSVTVGRPSQRRPGIHTDKHPLRAWGGGEWGRGSIDGETRKDGIYMASSLEASCRAWNFHVDIPGTMGDCEYLREELERLSPLMMKSHTLYWMTDSVPHESLPLKPGTFRQWFRLVTHKVDLWYEQHSTANPLGVLPACRTLSGNKFGSIGAPADPAGK
jgi:hypothetical protein